ncbi:MAG: universal stress protein [Novosphingobium sp.]
MFTDRDDRKGRRFPADRRAALSSRHGIAAELTELQRGDSIEETLAASVAQHGAELLVMGAYGHSRVREFLFGGVTRYFLEEEGGPALLLAH